MEIVSYRKCVQAAHNHQIHYSTFCKQHFIKYLWNRKLRVHYEKNSALEKNTIQIQFGNFSVE